LFTCVPQASPPVLRRQTNAGGLGSEEDDLISRRRTISGPIEGAPGDLADPSPRRPSQPRPEPRPRSTVAAPGCTVGDGNATLRRRPAPQKPRDAGGADPAVAAVTAGATDTIRRRPRTSDATGADPPEAGARTPSGHPIGPEQPQQNGVVAVVLRRKPATELCDRPEGDGESCEWMEARKSLRPPLSPKPSGGTLRRSHAEPTTPTRKVPLPGPDSYVDTAQSPGGTQAHTHTHSHTHSLTHSLTHSHTNTNTHAHSHIQILTQTHILTLTHTLTHSHTHTRSHSLTLTYSHSSTHSHTHTLSHTLKHTHTLMLFNY
jgi:hypothetical protein